MADENERERDSEKRRRRRKERRERRKARHQQEDVVDKVRRIDSISHRATTAARIHLCVCGAILVNPYPAVVTLRSSEEQ